jgi:hypothetical protein
VLQPMQGSFVTGYKANRNIIPLTHRKGAELV